ncbi:unnamed protein product [Zymoseptoria tritici ST99CH_1A5]|uniref:Uncharacterized protein n=1 Tax=Zymoseptoria tritici ST99CH_1A5 TaxID=1276529 RepID=A0A1Y6LT37_ZYMTR|nr:unnamed protein product [Zymoseptoria tritici ST99CH_3D1]SMY27556.1 unnamed protein product [Zymoseptoria tritici ST99CH_1A5]
MVNADKENRASSCCASVPSLTRTNTKAIEVAQAPSEQASKRNMHEAIPLANKQRRAGEERYRTTKRTAELVQDLPQELFDSILALVMAPDIPMTSIVHIDKQHKPPKRLQLTRSLHNNLARNYYATNVFSFTSLDLCRQWFKALAPQHSRWVKTMRYAPSSTAQYPENGGVMNNRTQKFEEARETLAGLYWKVTSGLMFIGPQEPVYKVMEWRKVELPARRHPNVPMSREAYKCWLGWSTRRAIAGEALGL